MNVRQKKESSNKSQSIDKNQFNTPANFSIYKINEKHANEGLLAIVRSRSKSPPRCMDNKISYSNLIQTANYFDFVANVLPCDENDMTKLSQYDQTSALTPSKSCEVCIISSSCTDEEITFNISISKYCQIPLNTYFTYHTDVHPKSYHYNITSNCSDCYITLSIEPINEAWDYTLTLKSPEPSENCPHEYVAHCGGNMSQTTWYIVGGLAGLGVILGILFCYIKHFRDRRPRVAAKKKKIEVAAINA